MLNVDERLLGQDNDGRIDVGHDFVEHGDSHYLHCRKFVHNPHNKAENLHD